MARTRAHLVVTSVFVALLAGAVVAAAVPGENERASSLPAPLGDPSAFRRVSPLPLTPPTTPPAPAAPTAPAPEPTPEPATPTPTVAPEPPTPEAEPEPAPVPSTVLSGAAGQLVGLINGVRAGLGLAPYAVDGELTANAQSWARSMAASGAMSHQSDLSGGLSSPWVRLGENVGVGSSVTEVHNALVASSGHYANIADPSFTSIGVGVVESGGTLYVAEEFMQL